MIPPKNVIVHCSDTPDYPPDDPKFDCFGVSDIDIWHKKRGFDSCGYHFVIRQTGVIENGRPCFSQRLFTPGAHCSGHNLDSIGICYIGRAIINKQQKEALRTLFRGIRDKFQIQQSSWYCHNQFNKNKTCPGFNIDFLQVILSSY